MRARMYQERTMGDGFVITGNILTEGPRTGIIGTYDLSVKNELSYQAITLLPGDDPAEQFYQELIDGITEYGNVIHDKAKNDPVHIDFMAKYKQIIRGEISSWRLVRFEIRKYDDGLYLAYQHVGSGKLQDVFIKIQTDRFSMWLELPPNSMGFSPRYYITLRTIQHPEYWYNAIVWEDLGYVCREIRVGKEDIDEDDGGVLLEVQEVCGL